jgi:MurNAc alpha-1-phosphate uridylyltransferase
MTGSLFPVALIAGGLATRLRPLTETIPKSLVEINGEPFISHQLKLLHHHGIREVVMCVGYLGEMIEAMVHDGRQFGMRIQYSYDGKSLLGTAGTLKKALPLLQEDFFVLYGDSYLPCPYQAIQNAFVESGKQALMTVFKNEGLWDKSNVVFENQKILIYDKNQQIPSMHHIDYGLGVFNKAAFDNIPDNVPFDLALLYQRFLNENNLAAFEVKERFYEVGSFSGIKELEQFLMQPSLTT